MTAEWSGSQNMPATGNFFFAQLRYVIPFLTSLRHVVRWNAHRAEDRNNIPLCPPSEGSWNSINITDSISCQLDAATLPPEYFGRLPGKVCVVTFESDVGTVLNWVGTWKGKLLHARESVRAIISCFQSGRRFLVVGLKCIFSGLCNLVYCTSEAETSTLKRISEDKMFVMDSNWFGSCIKNKKKTHQKYDRKHLWDDPSALRRFHSLFLLNLWHYACWYIALHVKADVLDDYDVYSSWLILAFARKSVFHAAQWRQTVHRYINLGHFQLRETCYGAAEFRGRPFDRDPDICV